MRLDWEPWSGAVTANVERIGTQEPKIFLERRLER